MSETLFTPKRQDDGFYTLFHTNPAIGTEKWAPLFRWARCYRASGKQERLRMILDGLMNDLAKPMQRIFVKEGKRSDRLYPERLFEAALQRLVEEMGATSPRFYKRWPGT